LLVRMPACQEVGSVDARSAWALEDSTAVLGRREDEGGASAKKCALSLASLSGGRGGFVQRRVQAAFSPRNIEAAGSC
jgi:hypothetical protein